MVIGSKELIRDMNSKLVLEAIMKNGPISRAAVSKQLGLTKATISAIVQQLLIAGLVSEIGSQDTCLGRKPILLSFQRKAGVVAGIDIGLTTISVLVTDLSGGSRNLKQIQTPEVCHLVEKLSELLESMLIEARETSYGLVGITVGIHGIVADNQILFCPYYDFAGYDLGNRLASNFGVPVTLENEANLSVIGESTLLQDARKNLANLSIHSGVGLGLMLDGRLYTGAHGAAGEFGHTIIELDGRPCPCGNCGCVEQYLSEQALLAEYAAYSGCSSATLEEFTQAYQRKDTNALQITERFLRYLLVCLNNIQNGFDPDLILINSSFTILFPELLEQLKLRLSNRPGSHPEIAASRLKDLSVLLGGVCAAIRNFLGLDHWILAK